MQSTAMVKIINAINEQLRPGYSDILGSGSINVGVIEGGTRSSVVPDKCIMKISKFVVEGESGQEFATRYPKLFPTVQIVRSYSAGGSGLHIQLFRGRCTREHAPRNIF